MRMKQLLPVPAALAVAVAFIDVPSAQARGQGHFGAASPTHFGVQRVQPARVFVPQVRPHLTVKKTVKFHTDHPVKHAKINRVHNNNGKQAKLLSNEPKKARVTSYHQRMGKPLAGSMTTFKGKVPQHIKPKFTVTKTLNAQVQKRLHPFVEKHWKRPFVWLAFADIGYITVPELYYDRFLACIEDNEYDRCIYLLSRAAMEEEEPVARVRYKMPSTAVYRYAAKLAPSEVAQAAVKSSPTAASAGEACAFEPFVERKWNSAFVWVQIPQTGNITVPEDYYDRFYGSVAATPPNYQAACAVLVEAAAADMMTTAATSAEPLSRQIN